MAGALSPPTVASADWDAIFCSGFRAYHNERATARLADLFQHLDENGEAEGITDFAVGEIDLDDVFARVLHKAHAKGGQETD